MTSFPVATPDLAFPALAEPERVQIPRCTSDQSAAMVSPRRPSSRPQQFQMRKGSRLSASAADVLDVPMAGPSNLSRISSAASFRSHELGRIAAETTSPADRYKMHYATSPLAPRQAMRSPSQTPPMNSPEMSRFQRAGSFRRTSLTNEASDYYDYMQRSQLDASAPTTPRSVKNKRRLSEQSFASAQSLSTSFSQATNFGTLIGSYEESLLSGRMSTMPSKPLDFDAELGVLGLGKCKAALRCPPHINMKFPAHFYNLESATLEREGKVSPSSPYVGTLDLDAFYTDRLLAENPDPEAPSKPRFPGYQVPPKGQIQLIIKNPNLTAVKVFLVPYDVSDMKPGTKTFVRQKCHFTTPSTPNTSPRMHSGSFRDVPLDPDGETERSPLLGRPKAGRAASQPRDALRYAVHLQFCAMPASKPAKHTNRERHAGFEPVDRLPGHRQQSQAREAAAAPRVYLHKNIRVVFTARVPDNSEKCTVTTDTPKMSEAKGGGNMYSTYAGPPEEWTEARRLVKQREMERRALHTMHHGMEQDGVFAFPAVGNSDPNGERPEAQVHVGDGIDVGTHSRQLSRNGEEDNHVHSNIGSDYGSASEALDIPDRRVDLWRRRKPTIHWQQFAKPEAPTDVSFATQDHRSPPAGAPSMFSEAIGDTGVRSAPRQRTSALHISLESPRTQDIASPATVRTPPAVPEHAYDERALLEHFHSSLGLRSQYAPPFGSSPGASHTSAHRPSSPSQMRPRPLSPPMQAANGALRGGLQQAYPAPPATTTAMAMAMARTSSNVSLSGAISPTFSSTAAHVRLASGATQVTPQPLQTVASPTSRPSFARRASASSTSSHTGKGPAPTALSSQATLHHKLTRSRESMRSNEQGPPAEQ